MNTENTTGNNIESEQPPYCDVQTEFIHCVNNCMRTTGYTRRGLAKRMNEALQALEIEIDENKLNKWFALSQSTSMPIHYLPALLWALNSTEPADVLLAPLVIKAVDNRAILLQEAAQCDFEIKKLEARKQKLFEKVNS
ncbi:hypothetical protein J8M21_20770 [Pseudoalteromonas luteoviolacea]|uniref:hypothetical protein n=1 Tax=Pseudoalteromonas luteoviolacea TaxID=43657 RepID=UPI001B39F665|nr:hypothetical protein [Pseudoalteromonas luteoviolacea]MBQ4879655.1 hypothetical protein [Pseudoalteromonas luteoviolacea]MBQ4908671.1 hypothetical protein [Pseudoalteromonas luteoviolacea]